MFAYGEEKEIKLILADDHEVVRAGLKRLLSIDKTITVLSEAGSGLDAVDQAEYYKPDIAILDIFMPRMDGIEATEIIRTKNSDVLCVILTAFEDSHHIERALDAGAEGYLSKDIGASELVGAIHKVMDGERVFTKSVINILQKKYMNYREEDKESIVITKREQEILNLVADGMTSPQIADKLKISVRTVQTHRANIMGKLGVKNAAELVRYALTGKTK